MEQGIMHHSAAEMISLIQASASEIELGKNGAIYYYPKEHHIWLRLGKGHAEQEDIEDHFALLPNLNDLTIDYRAPIGRDWVKVYPRKEEQQKRVQTLVEQMIKDGHLVIVGNNLKMFKSKMINYIMSTLN